MTDLDAILARVRELDAAATKGPWHAGTSDIEHARVHVRHDVGSACTMATPDDAALIAFYRTAAPVLATALEAAMAENERLRARGAHLEYILATPKTNPLDDPLLTCVLCGAEHCDACFNTRGGGQTATFGIHTACRRAARAALEGTK